MTSVTDYVGRTFDLVALRGAGAAGDVRLDQTLFDAASAGQICTGAQKVAQTWAILFLTDRGSKKFRQADGTVFMRTAKSGRFRTEVDVHIAFQLAAIAVRSQMLRQETANMVDEDRFASAELLGLQLFSDSLSLRVAVTTRAGDQRKIILPISLVPTTTRL